MSALTRRPACFRVGAAHQQNSAVPHFHAAKIERSCVDFGNAMLAASCAHSSVAEIQARSETLMSFVADKGEARRAFLLDQRDGARGGAVAGERVGFEPQQRLFVERAGSGDLCA